MKIEEVLINAKIVYIVGILWALVFILGIISVIFLYPVNFDEGYNLQIPINLIKFGLYGSRTSEGVTLFDPFISTGPLVLVPITIPFIIFGQGIVQARLISGLYAFGVMVLLVWLTERLYGGSCAILSLLLLVITKDVFWILGMVLGEGAGVFYILLGMFFWAQAEEKNHMHTAIWAGLSWGLAVWAKPSMMMAVLIIVSSLFVYAWFSRSKYVGLALISGCIGLLLGASWPIWSWIIIGNTPPRSLLAQQFSVNVAKNIARNLSQLVLNLGFPCIIGSLLTLRRLYKSCIVPSDLMEKLCVTKIIGCVLAFTWIFWWVLFNGEANYRHLFPSLIWGNPLLASSLTFSSKERSSLFKITRIGLTLLVILNVFLPGGLCSYFLGLKNAYEGKEAQLKFAHYIARLDSDAQILGIGWFMAWDIAFLSGRTFGHLEGIHSGEKAYVVITPTIRRYSDAYHYALELIQRHSAKAVYIDNFGYVLYEIK